MEVMKIKLILLSMATLVLCSCTEQQKAHQEAIDRASARAAYIPKNDIEFKNYDRRNRIADDPTTIMWCTAAFPIPSSPLFTVPIVGKTTSGSKRTFESDPGPDGMYGSSGDYDYGFTPTGMYAEWRKMTQFCTNEPTVWQRQATTIAMQIDPELMKAHESARKALQNGNQTEALKILQSAINEVKK